jgi:hypothetical protein
LGCCHSIAIYEYQAYDCQNLAELEYKFHLHTYTLYGFKVDPKFQIGTREPCCASSCTPKFLRLTRGPFLFVPPPPVDAPFESPLPPTQSRSLPRFLKWQYVEDLRIIETLPEVCCTFPPMCQSTRWKLFGPIYSQSGRENGIREIWRELYNGGGNLAPATANDITSRYMTARGYLKMGVCLQATRSSMVLALPPPELGIMGASSISRETFPSGRGHGTISPLSGRVSGKFPAALG